MTTESAEQEEPAEFEGPDPRTWPSIDGVWSQVLDIRVLDEVLALLRGEIAQEDRGPARREAIAFLQEAGYQAREVLARTLLSLNHVEIPEKPSSPFARAGKVRAYTPGERSSHQQDGEPRT